jgi:hypothetical protein
MIYTTNHNSPTQHTDTQDDVIMLLIFNDYNDISSGLGYDQTCLKKISSRI